ncbi:Crp/Fnr family transcriptional regulator [Actibacterium sp. XHP0104]|uniref:Crp/Fnr family transcriptional regulator n=1 Tax=Actibacterium sp. XHP0104 TaxID=2984335 RepID=UPI0021E8C5FC|nr:Crp/Fnr family transcriptional regulator [Actibacterium sp. XHP0104]MCV2881267.1 Crp/Fnr family transcriptional regulator [Actibacterium sp. XHP0104]
MRKDFEQIARQSMLLSNAPEPLVDSLLEHAHVTHHARGETIFLQEELADAIYIVADGWVKLYRMAPSGTEAVVGTFTRGHSFGEAVALRAARYPVSAEAVTECELIRLDAALFLRLLQENPSIAVSMLTATYAHLRNLVEQVEQLKSQTGPQRVAEFLLDLAPSKTGRCEVTLPYDKVLIAGRLGMKPESLSRAFGKLKSKGVAIRQNAAVIEDVEALRAYTEDDPAAAWTR